MLVGSKIKHNLVTGGGGHTIYLPLLLLLAEHPHKMRKDAGTGCHWYLKAFQMFLIKF